MDKNLEKLKNSDGSVNKKSNNKDESSLDLGLELRDSAVNLIVDDEFENGGGRVSEREKLTKEASGNGQSVSNCQGRKLTFEDDNAEQIIKQIELLLKERIKSIEEKLDASLLKKSPEVYNSMIIYLRSLRVKLNGLANLVGKSIEFLRNLYNEIKGN